MENKQSKSTNQFSKSICARLGYYVYALVDPTIKNKPIFYIGKGKDNRVFQHAIESQATDKKTDKISTYLFNNLKSE